MPLKDYIQVDGLKITVSVNYVIPTQRFYAWRMALPSRSCSLCITYPKDLDFKIELYGMQSNQPDIKKWDGCYKLSSEKWILPDEGLVFQLIPKK